MAWYKPIADLVHRIGRDVHPQAARVQQGVEAQLADAQGSASLEDRLTPMLRAVYSELSRGDLTVSQYHQVIASQITANGILSADADVDSYSIGILSFLVRDKLKAKEIMGINDSYVALDSTPLSETVQRDVAAFEGLKYGLGIYLRQRLQENPVSGKEFDRIVTGYCTGLVPIGRLPSVVGALIGHYKREFTIGEPERFVGQFSESAIMEAFKKTP